MPARDPQTGKFVAGSGGGEFDRFEEMHWGEHFNVSAANLSGGTGQDFGEASTFEGVQAYDADTFLDRDEIGVMLLAEHHLVAAALSTESADGTFSAAIEVSAEPERTPSQLAAVGLSDVDDQAGDFTVEVNGAIETGQGNSADVVGRILHAIAHAPYNDTATGVGGAGTSAQDEWVGAPAAEPVWDVRDSIYLNGYLEQSNIDDGAVAASIWGRHVYGVREL